MAKRSIEGCRGILTGASSGIGHALATQLVQAGARLIVISRRGDRLEKLVESLVGASGRIKPLVGDVTNAPVRRAALTLVQQDFGGLDLLVNNAGMGAMGPFVEADAQRLRRVMEVNFFAPAEFIREAVPMLRAGVRPMVVNISSVLGHRAIANCAEYCASKFALQGLSESLRAELAPMAIELLVVSPGTTQTEFFEAAIDAVQTPARLAHGMTSEAVSRRVVKAIRQGRREVITGSPGKLLVWANRLFPRVLDSILARRSG